MGSLDAASRSDDQVIEAVLAGDREAYASIVQRYQRAIYNFAYRLLGNRDEAEDATQDAFVRAFQHLYRFRVGEPFRPWLYRIASNACTDRLRRRGRFVDPGEDDFRLEQGTASEPDPAESLERREAIQEVREAIDSLPEAYRKLFVLAHLQHLSYNDLVRITGLPMTIVKNRLYRARLMLKEKLSDDRPPLPGLRVAQAGKGDAL